MESTQPPLFGKTSPEPCLAETVQTLGQSLTKWQNYGRIVSNGQYWTRNISESRNDADGFTSSLSLILQNPSEVDARYLISPRAAAGILRRADGRGKQLPPILRQALQHIAEQ